MDERTLVHTFCPIVNPEVRPMTTLLPASPSRHATGPHRHTEETDHRPVLDRIARILLASALAGGIVWMLVHAEAVRAAEARLAAWWMNPWIPGGAAASDDVFMLWISENHLVGFQVTAECTAIILIAPLLALGACFALSTRVSWPRAVGAIVASAAVMVIVNQVRLALIGFSTLQGGLGAGYEFGHRFAGSAVGIAGFAIGLIILIAVAGVRRRRR